METSDKIIREAVENHEDSPAYYKRAALACLAEIKEIVERIHRSVEERSHKSDDSDRLATQMLAVQRLSDELRLQAQREQSEREKLQLQFKIQMMELERRLLSPKSSEDQK